jgi:hypothetical protein
MFHSISKFAFLAGVPFPELGQDSSVLSDDEDDVAVLWQCFIVEEFEVLAAALLLERLFDVGEDAVDQCDLGLAQRPVGLLFRELAQFCLQCEELWCGLVVDRGGSRWTRSGCRSGRSSLRAEASRCGETRREVEEQDDHN